MQLLKIGYKMEQIKKGYFLQYWREIAIALLIIGLLSMSRCEPDDIKADKKELNKVLDGVKVIKAKHKKLVDSLKQEDAKKDAKIAELKTDNTRQETIIAENKKQLKNKQREITRYTYQQSAQYLAERYNTKAVSAEGNSVVLKGSVPNKIISELAEKDVLIADVKNYNKIIDNKSTQIKLGEEKLLNKSLELASKDLEAKELERGLNLSLDLTKKIEKDNRKLKRNNTLKTFTIIGAFIGGGYIGTKIK
jgi:hypothetical protein